MASTNKTTHYDLSQYVASDKPTYLGDYNTDMSKIDTAINSAQTKADTADLAATTAQTTAETAQTTANTAITNAATADSKATTITNNVGSLGNLTTAEKTTIVGAINEVDGDVGNLSALETTTKSSLVAAINEVRTEEEGVLLWENPNITQPMNAQTLVQNASQYEYIKVIYNYGSNDDRDWEQICFKGSRASMIALVYFNGVFMRSRDITFTAAGAINISNGDAMGSPSSDAVLPLKIVGFTKKYHN